MGVSRIVKRLPECAELNLATFRDHANSVTTFDHRWNLNPAVTSPLPRADEFRPHEEFRLRTASALRSQAASNQLGFAG